MSVKIFYDGAIFGEYDKHPDVVGFTTNTSFVAAAPLSGISYRAFADDALKHANGRPISFQVVGETLEEIEKDAREILTWADNVYVKIPIVSPLGESTVSLIQTLHAEDKKVNVTTVYTQEQIDSLSGVFNTTTPAIVSIFAGGISDTGIVPDNHVRSAVQAFADYDNVEVLWAGCQRLVSIKEAEQCGCDIVTVPGDLLRKTGRFGVGLHQASVAKSRLFYEDGARVRLCVTSRDD
jgi:transaldolase